MVDYHHTTVDHQLNLLALMVSHIVNFFAIFDPILCDLMALFTLAFLFRCYDNP
jgi:hypothetical protein